MNTEETSLLRLMRLIAGGKGSLGWNETLQQDTNANNHSLHRIMRSMQRKGVIRYEAKKCRIYLEDAA